MSDPVFSRSHAFVRPCPTAYRRVCRSDSALKLQTAGERKTRSAGLSQWKRHIFSCRNPRPGRNLRPVDGGVRRNPKRVAYSRSHADHPIRPFPKPAQPLFDKIDMSTPDYGLRRQLKSQRNFHFEGGDHAGSFNYLFLFSHSSVRMPCVDLGCRKAMVMPSAPLRGVLSIRRMPCASASASCSSMFSQARAMW